MTLTNLDARIKLLMLVAVSSVALLVQRPLTLAAVLFLTLILLLLGGVDHFKVWRQTRAMISIIAGIFLIQCVFCRDGLPLITIGNMTLITTGGFQMAIIVALRLLIIVSSALIVLTGDLRDYLLALRWCRLPYEIVYMTLAALRFIPLLRDEATSINSAMQMRGYDFKSVKWKQRIKQYMAMMLPVTASALHRAVQMSIAMETRAFRCMPNRSQWRSLKFAHRDIIYVLIFFALLIAILLLLK